MNPPYFKTLVVLALTSIGLCLPSLSSAQTPAVADWPDLYDPFTLLSIDLEMAPGDWSTIVADTTFDIEVPAMFSAEDEAPILVSVRRKSATRLGRDKVSLKIDINEYHGKDEFGGDLCEIDGGFADPVCVSKWHGVKKLSIENGDDENVLTEGFAWYLHRVASVSALDYSSGLASWVTVTVNGESKGIYVNVAQPDKQYLKNHGLWAGGDDTWLYKYSDVGSPKTKQAPEDAEGNPTDSPAIQELCYPPFQLRNACRAPRDFKDQLNARINMEGLLTFGAVSAFHNSPDDLFGKDKNYYVVDYSSSELGKREYLQWDLDSAINNYNTSRSIYDQRNGRSDVYEESLVESPDAPFRAEYDDIMRGLLEGPFDETNLLAALDQIESVIGAAMDADSNNQLEDGAASVEFDRLRRFVSDRIQNVWGQLP